jgi:hypothetical protein
MTKQQNTDQEDEDLEQGQSDDDYDRRRKGPHQVLASCARRDLGPTAT